MTGRIEFAGLAPYLDQLKHSRVLTREEEVALSRKAQLGDTRAREELVRNNLPLVISVAKKYLGRGTDASDLIQEGNLGLLTAVKHFDPELGNRFATYAVWWIRATMTRHLQLSRSQVRGGIKNRAGSRDLSLNSAVADDEAGDTYLDRLVDEDVGPELEYLTEEHGERVRAALNQVRGRIGELGWEIVQERLTKDEPATLEVIGERWGLSRERVRQVEIRTKKFLSRFLANDGFLALEDHPAGSAA